jgi:hypothetical protein
MQVFPSLAAWPVLLAQTDATLGASSGGAGGVNPAAPGSLIVAVLLGLCWLSDRSYARAGAALRCVQGPAQRDRASR